MHLQATEAEGRAASVNAAAKKMKEAMAEGRQEMEVRDSSAEEEGRQGAGWVGVR